MPRGGNICLWMPALFNSKAAVATSSWQVTPNAYLAFGIEA